MDLAVDFLETLMGVLVGWAIVEGFSWLIRCSVKDPEMRFKIYMVIFLTGMVTLSKYYLLGGQ